MQKGDCRIGIDLVNLKAQKSHDGHRIMDATMV